MANAAQTPKLQLGKLSPEDAERLASTFRPIWDLDDAPFAQGSALSAADVDVLAGGAGIAPSIRGTQHQQQEPKTEVTSPRASVPGHVPAMDAPKVEISVELDPADLVTATPAPVQQPQVAQARPQQPSASSAAATTRKPYTPPRPPPQSINMADASSDFAPVKKSNTGIIIGIVAVVAIVGGIFGVKAVMSGDKTQSGNKASASETNHQEGTHIPPPPEVAATQEATAAPAQTQAPVAKPVVTNDSPIVKEFPGSSTTTSAPATTHNTTTAIHQTHPAGGGGGATTTHTASGGGGKPAGKPAIVRDNPF